MRFALFPEQASMQESLGEFGTQIFSGLFLKVFDNCNTPGSNGFIML